jgi:hypothetical protein
VCSSVHLVRRLGEAECRDCGSVGQPLAAATLAVEPGPGGPISPGSAAAQDETADATADDAADTAADEAMASLAKEVEQALSRVLGTASSPRPPYAMS